MECVAVGDVAITYRPGPGERVSAVALAEALRADPPAGVRDVMTAFDRVTVVYDAVKLGQADPIGWLSNWMNTISKSAGLKTVEHVARTMEIAVDYGGRGGPDFYALADSLSISPADLIDQHAGACYTVAAVGFLPGFAYLDGLPTALHVPRRPTPRPRVPAGSVAIGGPYTGVYPVDSPGGWHLIGRTAMTLFDPANPEAVPFRVGDRVRFVPLPKNGRRA